MTDDAVLDPLVVEVLQFWFEDACESRAKADARLSFWFEGTPENDARARERFAGAVDAALAGELGHWAATPRGRLALVLLLDQFTRNLNRGTSAAFTGDAAALRLALDGFDSGAAAQLHLVERVFMSLPLEHAEDRAVQARNLAWATQLHADADDEWRPFTQGVLDAIREHHDIIARFCRFPHRNAALGRANSQAEQAYLDAGARHFGQ